MKNSRRTLPLTVSVGIYLLNFHHYQPWVQFQSFNTYSASLDINLVADLRVVIRKGQSKLNSKLFGSFTFPVISKSGRNNSERREFHRTFCCSWAKVLIHGQQLHRRQNSAICEEFRVLNSCTTCWRCINAFQWRRVLHELIHPYDNEFPHRQVRLHLNTLARLVCGQYN